MLHGEREREIHNISLFISNTSRREIVQYFRDKVVYSVDIQETSDMYQKMTPFQGCNLLFHGSMS